MTMQQLDNHLSALRKAQEARSIFENMTKNLEKYRRKCIMSENLDYILSDTRKDLEEFEASVAASEISVRDYVSSVHDPFLRSILYFHYLCGFTWKETAYEIGGGNTSDTIRQTCYRHFRKA